MYPKLFYFLIPAVLLLAAAVVIFLWERKPQSRANTGGGAGESEGAFRAFYHALWVLVLWSGLCLSLPLWISYREHIAKAPIEGRYFLVLKALVFPTMMLALLWYGGKQGYLKWIDSLSWPDKENE